MAWYRKPSRFILDAFRRINPNTSSNSVKSRISEVLPPPLLRNNGAKRLFFMERNKLHNFKPTGYKRWSQNPRTMIMLSCGAVLTVYFSNMEIVPYTKRPQYVVLSSSREKQRSDSCFEEMKEKYKEQILPPLHPQNIRVQEIAQKIVEAQKELRKEPHEEETIARRLRNSMINFVIKLGKGKSQTAHLEGFEWEVIVVNEPTVHAYCMPSGKIVVFSGLLHHFKEDAEVATIIGHEVGHAIARHYAEKFSRFTWEGIAQLFAYNVFNIYDDHYKTLDLLHILQIRTFSHRMEMEADYIGILLMARAGYDPRVAPKVYEKLRNYGCDSPLKDQLPLLQNYLAYHPCGEKRAKLLSEDKVMEEALSLYKKN